MHWSWKRAAASTLKPMVWMTRLASASASALAAAQGSPGQVSLPSLTSTIVRDPGSLAMSRAASSIT